MVSSVKVSQTPDTTHAYSRHLIWSLAETTTTKLIFSVPAVPLVFRYPILLERLPRFLRSRLATRFGLENTALASIGDKSSNRASHHQPPDYDRLCKEEEEVRLTEVEPTKTRHGREPTLSPDHFYGGILRTTEIAITTTEGANPARRFGRKAKSQQSWLEC